jgi:NitT/TauT family transport system substrate-binding protein
MRMRIAILTTMLLSMLTTAAFAETTLKVAIPQKGFWDSEFVEFAQKLGMFKKEGLDVQVFWTHGGSETLQAAISGSTDMALSNGTLGVVGAYFKGAPVRIISAEMTGVHEVYWYVKADSPIKSIKDLAGKTIAYSRPGSSTNLMLLNLIKEYDIKGAKPTSTGGVPGTRTQVMSGQIDVGWSVAPFGVQEINEGKIRVVVKAGQIKGMQGQTIRVNVANLNSLKTKREAITKFMKVYSEAIDWAYSGKPEVYKMYGEIAKVSPEVAKKTVEDFFPKSALQLTKIEGLQKTLDEALQYKRITEKKTVKDAAGLIDIVYKPGS